mgnify:CR=1 FL=1
MADFYNLKVSEIYKETNPKAVQEIELIKATQTE